MLRTSERKDSRGIVATGDEARVARAAAKIRGESVCATWTLKPRATAAPDGVSNRYSRVVLFKWCFLFWIGQALAIGGLMGVMLRLMR